MGYHLLLHTKQVGKARDMYAKKSGKRNRDPSHTGKWELVRARAIHKSDGMQIWHPDIR